MKPTARHREAEARFRQLLEWADVESPDRVEYRPVSVTFCWDEPKVAVVVEIYDEPLAAA